MVKINLITVFKQVIFISIMGTLPAAGIILFKAILKERLSARLQYYIWFLLILRLLIPITIDSPVHIFNYKPIPERIKITHQPEEVSDSKKDIQINPDKKDTLFMPLSQINSANPVMNINYLAVLWLTVMIGIYLYIVFVNIVFAIRLRQCIPCTQLEILDIINNCKSKLHITNKVKVLFSHHVKSPMVWGIFFPRILLPINMVSKLSQEELSHILLHELAHIKRKDLIIHFVTMIINGIHWFNPIIWYSVCKMKEDCELSCDASVLGILAENEYKSYGLTLLSIMKKIYQPQPVQGTVGFAFNKNKRRIIMITQYKKTSKKWAFITTICLVLLTGCSSLSDSGNTNASTSSQNPVKAENSSENGGQDSDSKVPPADNSNDTSDTLEDKSSTDVELISFQKYSELLGLSKQDLIDNMSEKPESVDEGGLEFKETGIRVWFNSDTGVVSQVYTDRDTVDFNGARIGDKIEVFKTAFGEPVSNQNGDIHFKSENIYISVNYDTETDRAVAVYLLSEDF